PPHWERGEVIAAMRAWMREKGAAPTSEDWAPGDPGSVWARESPRWPSSVTVKTLFGSWRGGVAAAGLAHEVRIAAAPETVFRYFTDPERMTRWLGAEALLDPRPGGVCRIVFDDRTAVSGEFVEVEPPRRIALRLGWE